MIKCAERLIVGCGWKALIKNCGELNLAVISGVFPLVVFLLNWTLFRAPLRRWGFLFYSSLCQGKFILEVFFHLCITLRKILSAGSLTNLTKNRAEPFCLISSCRERCIKLVLRNEKIKIAVVVHKSIPITSFQVIISGFYLLLSFISIANKTNMRQIMKYWFSNLKLFKLPFFSMHP